MDAELGSRIDRHCQALGLIVRPLINMCVLSPPLTITKAQIDEMVSILRQGICWLWKISPTRRPRSEKIITTHHPLPDAAYDDGPLSGLNFYKVVKMKFVTAEEIYRDPASRVVCRHGPITTMN